jgi:two-component system osmolarity sensor histidine kinase EnvZ
MLAQFLDMARSMSAEQPCPTDVVALLVHAAFDAGFDAERAGELDLVVPERLEAMLRPGASARAIANLLGNALRHGTGPYRLAARVEGRELVIEVADSGAGFGPEMAEALCRPFARGMPRAAATGPGWGWPSPRGWPRCMGAAGFRPRGRDVLCAPAPAAGAPGQA